MTRVGGCFATLKIFLAGRGGNERNAAQCNDMARTVHLLEGLRASTPTGSVRLPLRLPLRLRSGDLRHDIVLGAGDRWAAIDPKAAVGEVPFEPANALRGP